MSSGLDLRIPLQAQTLLLLQIFTGSLCFGRGLSPNLLSLLFKTFSYRLSGSYSAFSSPLWDAGMIELQFLSAKFWGPFYKLLLLFSLIKHIYYLSLYGKDLQILYHIDYSVWPFCFFVLQQFLILSGISFKSFRLTASSFLLNMTAVLGRCQKIIQ